MKEYQKALESIKDAKLVNSVSIEIYELLKGKGLSLHQAEALLDFTKDQMKKLILI